MKPELAIDIKEVKDMSMMDMTVQEWEDLHNQLHSKFINIKYLVKDIDKIEYKEGSDWIDLRAAEDIHMNKGEFKLIPLGVCMKLPIGYEAHLSARSSTFKKYGIIQTNAVGVIDETYCGNEDEWKFAAYAVRDTDINKNDRICQFRIMEKQPKIIFKEVDNMEDQSRGGFGSTGVQ